MKLETGFLFAVSLLISACDPLPLESGVDYEPVTTLRDSRTGRYVELAQLETFSSHGFAVYVFDDAGPRKRFDSRWAPVMKVAGIEADQLKFSIIDECYVMVAEYRIGGLITPRWKDPVSGGSICFDLRPERGPKGGFTP